MERLIQLGLHPNPGVTGFGEPDGSLPTLAGRESYDAHLQHRTESVEQRLSLLVLLRLTQPCDQTLF
jgi:hypothetical protein